MGLFAHDCQQRFLEGLRIKEEPSVTVPSLGEFRASADDLDGSRAIGREALVDVVLLAVQEEIHRRGGLPWPSGIGALGVGLGSALVGVRTALFYGAVDGSGDLLTGRDGLIGGLFDVVWIDWQFLHLPLRVVFVDWLNALAQ